MLHELQEGLQGYGNEMPVNSSKGINLTLILTRSKRFQMYKIIPCVAFEKECQDIKVKWKGHGNEMQLVFQKELTKCQKIFYFIGDKTKEIS